MTLTPTPTPNTTQTIIAVLTAAANEWTSTPTATATLTPSRTPNYQATTDMIIEQIATATAQAMPLPSATPNLTATVAVAVDQAVSDMLTAMPSTPNVEATVDAAVIGLLPSGCFMINPPLELATIHTQPLRDAAELRATLPSLSLVLSRMTRGDDIWLELLLLQPGTPQRGWMLVPAGMDDATLYWDRTAVRRCISARWYPTQRIINPLYREF